MGKLVPPHGGELTPRLVEACEVPGRLAAVKELPQVEIGSREVSDLLMIGMGAFSPLKGFMGKADYDGVVADMHLANGTLWPIPITLPVAAEVADGIKDGDTVALVEEESGDILATMVVEERYTYCKQTECLQTFRTEDPEHPGVQKVMAQGEVCLGGPVEVLNEAGYPEQFPEYARPAETRAIFEAKGWSTITAFQTRNPIHRSHEYLTKVALEITDGLFIHPIVGKLKPGDIPAETRMKCYNVLLENFYNTDRVVLKVYPMEMRYAGPTEAILHAIIRQNFGCSHLCVGRDHAGVGSYYGPFEAQEIFDSLKPGELALQPLKFENTFYCKKCLGMASIKTCPHGKEEQVFISGTKLREMLGKGEIPPVEFSRKEVVEILVEYYRSLNS